MKDYHINIFYSEADDGYIADLPELHYCSAFGEPPAEALQELEIAKQTWLEAAQAKGKLIPPPTYRPVIYQLKIASEPSILLKAGWHSMHQYKQAPDSSGRNPESEDF